MKATVMHRKSFVLDRTRKDHGTTTMRNEPSNKSNKINIMLSVRRLYKLWPLLNRMGNVYGGNPGRLSSEWLHLIAHIFYKTIDKFILYYNFCKPCTSVVPASKINTSSSIVIKITHEHKRTFRSKNIF